MVGGAALVAHRCNPIVPKVVLTQQRVAVRVRRRQVGWESRNADWGTPNREIIRIKRRDRIRVRGVGSKLVWVGREIVNDIRPGQECAIVGEWNIRPTI